MTVPQRLPRDHPLWIARKALFDAISARDEVVIPAELAMLDQYFSEHAEQIAKQGTRRCIRIPDDYGPDLDTGELDAAVEAAQAEVDRLEREYDMVTPPSTFADLLADC